MEDVSVPVIHPGLFLSFFPLVTRSSVRDRRTDGLNRNVVRGIDIDSRRGAVPSLRLLSFIRYMYYYRVMARPSPAVLECFPLHTVYTLNEWYVKAAAEGGRPRPHSANSRPPLAQGRKEASRRIGRSYKRCSVVQPAEQIECDMSNKRPAATEQLIVGLLLRHPTVSDDLDVDQT